MSNTDPKTGGWAAKNLLTSVQMNLVRVGVVNSIDGAGGGNYSPSAKISIQGSNGLEIAGTGAGARVRYSSRNIPRTLPKQALYANSTDWTFDHDPAFQFWSAVGSADILFCDLLGIPNGAVINEIVVNARENGASAIDFKLQEIAADDNAIADVFAFFADAAVSGTFHAITKTAIAKTIDKRESRYVLVIRSGQAGDDVASVQVNITLTDQSEWDP
jgi:hypothetical protein